MLFLSIFDIILLNMALLTPVATFMDPDTNYQQIIYLLQMVPIKSTAAREAELIPGVLFLCGFLILLCTL